jgi:hypothetical protein
MTNLRTPPVLVDNAEFWLEVANPRPFYFVGDTPKFTLCARQREGTEFTASLRVRWDLLREAGSTTHLVPKGNLKLSVSTTRREDLDIEWVPLPGSALYTLEFSGVKGTTGGDLTYDVRHPVASYEVFDRGVHEEEQRLNRRTLCAFVGSILASAFLGLATIVLALVTLGVIH